MTYLEWNKKLFDHYFNKSNQKEFFVLNATTDLINELGEGLENPIYDFINALKTGPVDNTNKRRYEIFPQNFNIIDKAVRLKKIWLSKNVKENQFIPRDSGNFCSIPRWSESYPPFIAYLFYLVYKVEVDEKKYWNSINSEIGKPNVGSNDGLKVIKLFEELKNYSKEFHNKNFYFTNIYSGGGRKYVGTIESQLPLTSNEKLKLPLFFSECGILRDEVEQLGNQELIDLLSNSGYSFFEKSTIDILKQNDNAILIYLIIEEIRSESKRKTDWDVNVEEIEKKAKLRIKNDSELILAYYANYSQFTVRIKSKQDFTAITFNNRFHVQKHNDDISENLKDYDNRYVIVNDTKKIPKILYDNSEIKLDLKKDYILFDYLEKDIYVQSKKQQYNEAYLLVFKSTKEIEYLISNKNIQEIPCSIINTKLYRTETYLRITDLGDLKPRITFEGGAKKDTGVYSKYWLPQVNFHYAEYCSLKIIIGENETNFEKCPLKLDLTTFNNYNQLIKEQGVDKIIFQLKEYENNQVIEKELSLNIEKELSDIEGIMPYNLKNVDLNKYKYFEDKYIFQLKPHKEYDWSKDKILVELTSISDKKGFITSKKLRQVLYSYLKQAYFEAKSIEDRKSIDYVNDLRDPLIKMMQGLGHITKYNDSKGSFKGIFVSPPYVLPVSYNPDGQKTFVIRGMRNSELIESLKKDPKVINFEQRISTMFSNQTLNAIYPTEIYFTIRDILPIIDKLNIKLVDKILQPLHLELLPNSINSLVDDNNVWYGKINFEEAIDNPFDISSDNYEFPALFIMYPNFRTQFIIKKLLTLS